MAILRVADEADGGLSGLSIDLKAAGTSIPVTEVGGGIYRASITPTVTSGEIPIDAKTTDGRASESLTALVLPTVGDEWDQPITIGGRVNTTGTEDSSTISPDGEWLIVGTYEPIDTLCCVFHCGDAPDGRNSACQTVTGPYTAPARPNMPGAERVPSTTRILQADGRMCLTAPDGGDFTLDLPDGGTLVPTITLNGAYGFHRQADGTFAEPFLIGFQDDGFGVGPLFFVRRAGEWRKGECRLRVQARGRFRDPSTSSDRHTLTLGSDNVLGSYSCDAGSSGLSARRHQRASRLARFAKCGQLVGERGLLVERRQNVTPALPLVAQMLSDGGVAPWTSLALPVSPDDRRQPVLRNGRIYYYRNARVSWPAIRFRPRAS